MHGEKFDLFCLREPDYVMILISTYGSLNHNPNQRDSVRINDKNDKIIFKYNNVVGNHYEYCDAVDQHNAKRHDCGTKLGLSLEDTWRTTRWPIRVFSFILALTEVNAFLSMKYFGGLQGTQWEFRKKLAYQLIHNGYELDGGAKKNKERRNMRSINHHKIISAPPFSKFVGSRWQKNIK